MIDVDLNDIRLLLLDGRALSRAAMSVALDAEPDLAVVAAAESVAAAAVDSTWNHADVAVVDASLARPGQQHPCAALKTRTRVRKVVVFDERPDRRGLLAAIRAGADGYVTRDEPLATIVEAIRTVHEGGARIPAAMLADLLRDLSANQRQSEAAIELLQRLTRREKEVLALLADGCDHIAVADILTISPQTARTHIQNIIQKFGVHSRLEVTALALEHGLTDPVCFTARS